MADRFRVADYGEFFATRYMAEQIAAAIAGSSAGTVVDFTGVVAVTHAFADELWTRLPVGVELVGLDEEVAATFAEAQRRRSAS